MRLWSLHPRYLDAKGLVAAWREASPPLTPNRPPTAPSPLCCAAGCADADGDDLGGAALLERELGAQMIEEIRHQ